MANICYRSYISWQDCDEAERDGNVLVLTSPAKTFVDVRLKPGAQGIQGVYPFEAVEWAFAGHSKTWLSSDDSKSGEFKKIAMNATTIHSRWYHVVDSHHVDASAVLDQGTLVPQPDGITSLESGTMMKPGTDQLQAYEEAWVDMPLKPDSEGKIFTVVLHFNHEHNAYDEERQPHIAATHESATSMPAISPSCGVVVRIANRCQGILRIGDRVTIEQWELDPLVTKFEVASDAQRQERGSWKRVVRVGDDFLPCAVTFQPERIGVGSKVEYGPMAWKVTEFVCSREPKED